MIDPIGSAGAVLCYVHEPCSREGDGHGRRTAYFTTQALADQWGDDWDDAPYDCNAEPPYLWDPGHDGARHGRARWTVFEVEFIGPFDTPAGLAPPVSVQDINSGIVAWLWAHAPEGGRWCPRIVVPAGVTLARFRELVAQAGGVSGAAVELKHWREGGGDGLG